MEPSAGLSSAHRLPAFCKQRVAQLMASGYRKILGLVAPPGGR